VSRTLAHIRWRSDLDRLLRRGVEQMSRPEVAHEADDILGDQLQKWRGHLLRILSALRMQAAEQLVTEAADFLRRAMY
jgi:hypothetical protein